MSEWRDVVQDQNLRLAQQMLAQQGEINRLKAEVARLSALTATCTCGKTYETYEGPEPDCAVHGAVRALNEAHTEIQRLQNVIDVRCEGDTWTVAVEIPMSLPQKMRHSLWTAITAAVQEWEPLDRDGWDVDISGYPTAHAQDRAVRAELERDRLRARLTGVAVHAHRLRTWIKDPDATITIAGSILGDLFAALESPLPPGAPVSTTPEGEAPQVPAPAAVTPGRSAGAGHNPPGEADPS